MSDLAELAKHYRRMADRPPTLDAPDDPELWRQLADELADHLDRQDQDPNQPALPGIGETP